MSLEQSGEQLIVAWFERLLVEEHETHRTSLGQGDRIRQRRLQSRGAERIVAALPELGPKQGARPLVGHHEQDPGRGCRRRRCHVRTQPWRAFARKGRKGGGLHSRPAPA